jgi:hypothetical protein
LPLFAPPQATVTANASPAIANRAILWPREIEKARDIGILLGEIQTHFSLA